jgi:hypothetical protein
VLELEPEHVEILGLSSTKMLMEAASLETQLMNLQGAPLWEQVGALEEEEQRH